MNKYKPVRAQDDRFFLTDKGLEKLLAEWDDPYAGEESYDDYVKPIKYKDGNKHDVHLGTYTNGTARFFEFKQA